MNSRCGSVDNATQRLKPTILGGAFGTTEIVPFPRGPGGDSSGIPRFEKRETWGNHSLFVMAKLSEQMGKFRTVLEASELRFSSGFLRGIAFLKCFPQIFQCLFWTAG